MKKASLINKRPISPHLQIYSIFSKTMASGPSIVYRITQVVLMCSTIYLALLLLAAASGPLYYGYFISFITSWFGYLTLVVISLCFYFHLTNGIRFLCFNLGYFLSKKSVMVSGWLAVTSAVVLWVITWGYIAAKITF